VAGDKQLKANLDYASKEQLLSIPGIGEEQAATIGDLLDRVEV
jgi:DNA uptake protein ComE-like DNA-binding protein